MRLPTAYNGTHAAEAQPTRTYVAQIANCSQTNLPQQLGDGRMMQEQVSDEERFSARLRRFNDGTSLIDMERQWFLDKNVLSGA